MPELPEVQEMVDVGRVADVLEPPPPAPERVIRLPEGSDVPPQVSAGLGFQRTQIMWGDTCRDQSTVVIIPSRDRLFHHKVVSSWQGLIAPMNQKRANIFCIGDEVGIAYNKMIEHILAHPEMGKWKYVLTLESDNLPPPDAHIRLLETIERGKWDAVGGVYFTKGDINQPMCYGDPELFRQTGMLSFEPRQIGQALQRGQVVECNGLAMGCTLYRMQLFREVPAPWFVTVSDIVEGKGPMGFTQDLYFCQTAKRMGKRFAVDMRVKVGHLDIATGIEY
jgi:hypothetical protein